MRKLKKLLETVAADRRGSVAILFGASALVLVLTIGLAIDGARAYNISTRISAALDAAALAAAKMLDDEDNSDADIRDRAQRFFQAHFTETPVAGVSVEPLDIDIDRDRGEVEIGAEVAVATTFGQLAGLNEFRFPRSARVKYNQKFIELALVLDITGSMCQPCDKIEGLKSAAREVVRNLINPQVPFGYTRIGIVPYSAAVNAGGYAGDVSGGSSTDGCVVERQGSHNDDDHAANGGNALGVSNHAANNKYECPTSTIMPLTSDRATLESKIDSLSTGGWTAGHIGLAWGWYSVTHRWNSLWPSEHRPKNPAPNVVKAVLMMTDGEFNTSYIPGPGMNATDVATANSSPEQAKRLCANMKAQSIVVYTVAFQAPTAAETLLRDCATSVNHYFPASSNAELFAAFRTISERLSALRVTL